MKIQFTEEDLKAAFEAGRVYEGREERLRHYAPFNSEPDFDEWFDILIRLKEDKAPNPNKAPNDWHKYHSPNCGTKFRGCDPINCPKEHYEKTGEWNQELVNKILNKMK